MTWEGPPAPYQIETERLVIRCYEPRDAPLLKESVDSSLEHLQAWMPWAHDEPQTVEQKLELTKLFRSDFDTKENFTYGIFAADESELLGGTGLHGRLGLLGLREQPQLQQRQLRLTLRDRDQGVTLLLRSHRQHRHRSQ